MHSDCRTLGLVLLLLGLASTGWRPVQRVLMKTEGNVQHFVIRSIDNRRSACQAEACRRLSMLKDAFLSEQCEPIEPPIALFASMVTPWGEADMKSLAPTRERELKPKTPRASCGTCI